MAASPMQTQADSSSADIRKKRISIELDNMSKLPPEFTFSKFETNLGLYIRFTIDRKLVKSEDVFSRTDKFVFDVFLDQRYPFQPPQIYARTPFSKPPLNDGRDLFSDIMRSEWRVIKKIHQIVQYIPDFIDEVIETEDEMKVFGTFHLGNYYEISNWGLSGMNRDSRVFECQEQDEQDQETYYPRRLVITQSALLLFEPQQQVKNLGLLLAWATLQSLDKLRRNLGRPDLVTFVWRQIEGKQPWVLNLLIPSHEECIKLIVANMQSMGVGVEKNTKPRILESEVSKESIAQMDIEQLLEHIQTYENLIQSDLSLQTVQTLNSLYQKAIEYYSAFDDLMFNDYLNKMHTLLLREDIQQILNTAEKEEKKPQPSFEVDKQSSLDTKSSSRQHQIDFNVEEEDDNANEHHNDDYKQEQQTNKQTDEIDMKQHSNHEQKSQGVEGNKDIKIEGENFKGKGKVNSVEKERSEVVKKVEEEDKERRDEQKVKKEEDSTSNQSPIQQRNAFKLGDEEDNDKDAELEEVYDSSNDSDLESSPDQKKEESEDIKKNKGSEGNTQKESEKDTKGENQEKVKEKEAQSEEGKKE